MWLMRVCRLVSLTAGGVLRVRCAALAAGLRAEKATRGADVEEEVAGLRAESAWVLAHSAERVC
eukprot:2348193-Rhodomonas_salina.1